MMLNILIMCFLAICVSSLEKCLSKMSSPIFELGCLFFVTAFWAFPIYPLSDKQEHIFSPVSCLFILVIVSVLVHLDYCNKITINWVVYKQQKFVFHHSGGWEVRDQGLQASGSFSVWGRPTSWFIDGIFLLCPRVGREGISVRVLISFMTPSRPKGPPPAISSPYGFGSTYRFWGDTDIQTVAVSFDVTNS